MVLQLKNVWFFFCTATFRTHCKKILTSKFYQSLKINFNCRQYLYHSISFSNNPSKNVSIVNKTIIISTKMHTNHPCLSMSEEGVFCHQHAASSSNNFSSLSILICIWISGVPQLPFLISTSSPFLILLSQWGPTRRNWMCDTDCGIVMQKFFVFSCSNATCRS
jgi:hypothetical protein